MLTVMTMKMMVNSRIRTLACTPSADNATPIWNLSFHRSSAWPWWHSGSVTARWPRSHPWSTHSMRRRQLLKIGRSWSTTSAASVLNWSTHSKANILRSISRLPNSLRAKRIYSSYLRDLRVTCPISVHISSHRFHWSMLRHIPAPSFVTVHLVCLMRTRRQQLSSWSSTTKRYHKSSPTFSKSRREAPRS